MDKKTINNILLIGVIGIIIGLYEGLLLKKINDDVEDIKFRTDRF